MVPLSVRDVVHFENQSTEGHRGLTVESVRAHEKTDRRLLKKASRQLGLFPHRFQLPRLVLHRAVPALETSPNGFVPLDEHAVQWYYWYMEKLDPVKMFESHLAQLVLSKGLFFTHMNKPLSPLKSKALTAIWTDAIKNILWQTHCLGLAVIMMVPDPDYTARPKVLNLALDVQVYVCMDMPTQTLQYRVVQRSPIPAGEVGFLEGADLWVACDTPPDSKGRIRSIVAGIERKIESQMKKERYDDSACRKLAMPYEIYTHDSLREKEINQRGDLAYEREVERQQRPRNKEERDAKSLSLTGFPIAARAGAGSKAAAAGGPELVPLTNKEPQTYPVPKDMQQLLQFNQDFPELANSDRLKDIAMQIWYDSKLAVISDHDRQDPELTRMKYVKNGYNWQMSNHIQGPPQFSMQVQQFIKEVAANFQLPVESVYRVEMSYRTIDMKYVKEQEHQTAMYWATYVEDICQALILETYGYIHSLYDLVRDERERRERLKQKVRERKLATPGIGAAEIRRRLAALDAIARQLQMDQRLDVWQLEEYEGLLAVEQRGEEEEEHPQTKSSDPGAKQRQTLDIVRQYNNISESIAQMALKLRTMPNEAKDDKGMAALQQEIESILSEEFEQFAQMSKNAVEAQYDDSFLHVDPASGCIRARLREGNLEIHIGLKRHLELIKNEETKERNQERLLTAIKALGRQDDYVILHDGWVRHRHFHVSGEATISIPFIRQLRQYLEPASGSSHYPQLQRAVAAELDSWSRRAIAHMGTTPDMRNTLLRVLLRRAHIRDVHVSVREFLRVHGEDDTIANIKRIMLSMDPHVIDPSVPHPDAEGEDGRSSSSKARKRKTPQPPGQEEEDAPDRKKEKKKKRSEDPGEQQVESGHPIISAWADAPTLAWNDFTSARERDRMGEALSAADSYTDDFQPNEEE